MRRLLSLLILVALAATGPRAFAYSFDDRFAPVGINDDVAAILRSGEDLIVGGRFDQIGPVSAYRIARFDGATWHPMGRPAWSRTETIAEYGGEIYASGQFGSSICKWDGSQWIPIGSVALPSYETHAFAMVPFAGQLVIGGGFFFEVDGHQGIFAWNGSALVEVDNHPDASNGRIADLVVYEGQLYATGIFEVSVDSVPMTALARYDGTTWTAVAGRATPGGPLVEGLRRGGGPGQGCALAVHDGKLVVAGRFDRAGDLPVSNLCTWDAATQMWGDVGGGSPQPVHEMATVNGDLYVGGDNPSFSGTPVAGIAMWDGSTWNEVGSWKTGEVVVLEDVGGALGIGGSFKAAGGLQVERFTVFDGSQYASMLLPGGQGVDAPVDDLCLYGGGLVAVGAFEYGGVTRLGGVGLWDGQSWSGLGAEANGRVRRVLVDGSDLVVAGDFTEIGGQPANHVARWDGGAWQAYGIGVPAPGEALCVHAGEVHVGGSGFVERWDGAAWQEIPLHPSVGPVSALASYGGDLVAGASYFIFSSPRFYATIARWDGATWAPMLTSSGTTMESGDGYINRFYGYQGDLFMGGGITSLGGIWPNAVITALQSARWDGTTLLPIPESTVQSPAYGVELFAAYDFATYDGRLFVAGSPETAGGSLWASDLVEPWQPVGDTDRSIHAAQEFDGSLYLGGAFVWVSDAWDDPAMIPSSYFGAMGPGATGAGPASASPRLQLHGNQPNPFNPSTTIRFEVPDGAGRVSLSIHDARGRRVRTLLSGVEVVSTGSAVWDGRDDGGRRVASGAYFCRLETEAGAVSRKMLLLK